MKLNKIINMKKLQIVIYYIFVKIKKAPIAPLNI
jgi:hypothetical protein